MKWVRQYEGPFLIIAKPTKLTARIQRSVRAQSQVVHVDKLKKFMGKPPKAWRVPEVSEQTEPLVERGTRLAGSPGVVDGSDVVQIGAENSGLPVGAAELSVGMPGVDPFSSTPLISNSYTDPDVEGRHDDDQSVLARQTVRAEVHNDQGFDLPNGQVESEVYPYMGFEQLNEQPELCRGSEQLTEQSELSTVTEQGVGQVGISPTAGEQRGSLASESNDLVRGERGGSTFASQPEVAVCCSGEDCGKSTITEQR